MSMQTTLTVTGWLGSEVRYSRGTDGATPYASFRLRCTQRRFDRAEQVWKDGPTTWFTVKAWRHVAGNVAASLRKGDPVVVHGRLSVDEWTGPDGPRTTLVIEAQALGHDLTFGDTAFRRTASQVPAGAAGEGQAAGDGEATAPAEDEATAPAEDGLPDDALPDLTGHLELVDDDPEGSEADDEEPVAQLAAVGRG